MKTNAYSIYDVKSLSYSPPFFAVADGVALRMLEDLVSDVNTSVGRHPKDFTLYRIGSFDDQSGELLSDSLRYHVADAVTLVRVDQPTPLFPIPTRPNGKPAATQE